MSKPDEITKAVENSIMGLLSRADSELMSASSSLHMPPDPIKCEDKDEDDMIFLNECDSNAKHSVEHIRAAHRFIGRARILLEKVRWNSIMNKMYLTYEGEFDD